MRAPVKSPKFFVISKGRLSGVWADDSWVFDEHGLNIKGGRPGIPYYPEQHQQLLQDVEKLELHLREQLAQLVEAKEYLPKIKVIPTDIATALRQREPLTKEQHARMRRLYASVKNLR